MRMYASALLFITNVLASVSIECPTTYLERALFSAYSYNRTNTKLPCEPIEHLVEISVPQGFEKVTPEVAVVYRCRGHMCEVKRHCVAAKDGKTDKMITIMAFKEEDKKCLKVPVETHNKCECRCSNEDEGCGEFEIFDEESCRCICTLKMKDCQNEFTLHEEKCKCVDRSVD